MASSSDQGVALSPPPGQVSNLINPQSLASWNLVCVLVCLITTTSVLFLRSYVRLWMKRQWILEDYMCCLSWALLASFCALNTAVMKHHGGVHEWDLTKAEARGVVRLFNIASIIYGPAIGCTKVSILLLYRRIFSTQKKSHFDRAVRLFIVILSLFYVAITLAKIFECTPRARIWDKRRPGTCVNFPNLLNASGAFNTLTDILLLLIPVKVSWDLNTSVKRKVGVVLLFTFGFLAPAFSIVGLVVRIRTSKSPDVTYNQPEILLWGAAEITTGLICVCVPPLAALTHPRLNGRQRTYLNFHSSDGRPYDSSRRTRLMILEERDLLTSSDVELQYSGAGPGVAFPLPLVTTGISGGLDANERRSEKSKHEKNVGLEVASEKAGEVTRVKTATTSIGVTTTVEQHYR